MDWNTSYEFDDSIKMLENNNQIILANRDEGTWIKLSRQSFDILKYGIEHKLSPNSIMPLLSDDKDRTYFIKLFDKLITLEAFKSTKTKNNLSIDFAITNKCNLKCTHCCVDADVENIKDPLSFDMVCNSLDKIISINPSEIVLTGGEPMIRKDFFDILNYLKNNYSHNIGLMTNATLINNSNFALE